MPDGLYTCDRKQGLASGERSELLDKIECFRGAVASPKAGNAFSFHLAVITPELMRLTCYR